MGKSYARDGIGSDPIVYGQIRDSLKDLEIGGDDGNSVDKGNRGYSHVGVANSYAVAFESGSKITILPGCCGVEWQNRQVCRDQLVDLGE